MKKSILLLLLSIMLLSACTPQVVNPLQSTGYPSGELQQPQIMLNGKIYYYTASGFDLPLPEGYTLAGEILSVDHIHPPAENFHGGRVEVGQKVYISSPATDSVYLQYSSGYALFALK